MISNVMVYLVGHSGVGKLTIARALAPLIQARVIDNHWINNPIFGLLDNDRHTPFPDAVWDEIDKVRDAVLTTIATLAAPGASFVFTHAGVEGDPDDRAIFQAIQYTAEQRQAVFVPVRLLSSEAELMRRVGSPERADRLKSMDRNAAAFAWRNRVVLQTGHQNEMTVDTSVIQPSECAESIARHIEELRS